MTFDRAPSYYAVASSRPLEEITLDTVRARHELGVGALRLELPAAKASPNVAKARGGRVPGWNLERMAIS